MQKQRLIVMGFMGAVPIAGVIWQHVHYIVGLQQLGHTVYYLEDSARLPYDPVKQTLSEDYAYAAATLAALAERFGFKDRWAYCPRYLDPATTAGLSRATMNALYRDADAILNLCGAQEFNQELLQNQRLIYVESDPGVEQIRVDSGDAAAFAYLTRHHRRFSFGENVGTPRFPVPLHNLAWLPTRQPVVTEFWATDAPPPPGALFCTIANWSTAGKKDVVWRGETYLWSKSAEFVRYRDAPRRAGETFGLASEIPDPETRADFLRHGWQLESPAGLSVDWNAYRRYIQRAKGEFTIAKEQYVRLDTAWFSDRSACYLAAGRPVITQDTGFTRLYGGERGLFGFSSLDQVADAVARINADYAAHARAAREIAREFFEAQTVLRSLLDRAGL